MSPTPDPLAALERLAEDLHNCRRYPGHADDYATTLLRAAIAETRAGLDEASGVAEAERLRTGLRCLIRDWAIGWDDADQFDQRDAYRALGDLLGPDFNTARTWIPETLRE